MALISPPAAGVIVAATASIIGWALRTREDRDLVDPAGRDEPVRAAVPGR